MVKQTLADLPVPGCVLPLPQHRNSSLDAEYHTAVICADMIFKYTWPKLPVSVCARYWSLGAVPVSCGRSVGQPARLSQCTSMVPNKKTNHKAKGE